ncbi:Eco57I restriction-modification methylase domain-containing protein [Lactococcus petauri]|uniref:Eco57I restriction-modification methylase domain-containing protein n=1 Tax=Lactococcus petauri TaxID=1940789 RepID=UPI003852BF7A
MQEISSNELIQNFSATIGNISMLADYLGFEMRQVESIQDTFEKDTIFAYQRPDNLDGIFAYAITQGKLTEETRANQFKKFFLQAIQSMNEKGETSSEVDFIIVVGKSVVIIFDSADYRKRLILTAEKLSRENSKYLSKFEMLKAENIQDKYKEDEDFGDILLSEEFKAELFRFSISEDEQFLSKTRILRLNFWKKIQEDNKCQKIIRDIFFKPNEIDEVSHYYGDIISAVLDTLVLRYLLVRILEGRFGYQIEEAKKKVSKIGLGTSFDKTLEEKAHFNLQRIEEVIRSKSEQLSLFDIDALDFDDSAISEIRDEQSNFMETIYGGDLYVSDIAKAATKIEKNLSEQEYALSWNLTSSSQLDFDLADITPGTIGEQYEQTLKMSLTKDPVTGKWEYNKDNSEQRALGAFYTNAKITEYIIDITLGKKLKEIKNELKKTTKEVQRVEILKNVLKLKMVDITSGGGTFLAGAVRKLGDWYKSLESMLDMQSALSKVKEMKTMVDFQKYAVNHMIYGVDVDLKALIVSSFALTLESLGDNQDNLPELIGKSLINQNSVISLVPESQKIEWFERYKSDIKELVAEKKRWISKKNNHFAEKQERLQKIFRELTLESLVTRKITQEDLQKTFEEKYMAVLEFSLPEVFFDSEGDWTGGFDIIFGNPPYIQLQKKEVFSDVEKEIYKKLGNFESYEATGDIYALFFERGIQLLKSNGYLGFITSNKYLRAGYGKSLRNYFLENTNPYLLVNLGPGMFGATVDTSILALEKSENKDELKAIDLVQRAQEPKKRIENMSDYIEQNKLSISYRTDESWTILSPIEQSIKAKIEAVGIPLKDWDISINYGIKTGYNEAFIISGDKRQKILNDCQSEGEKKRTAQLIRPILRGRDIKRYSYDFANLYLICTFPAKHYNIDDFPSVRDYLLTFDKRKLAQSGEKNIDDVKGNNARKKTNNKWFEVQDSIAYWDDFNKPKIIYPNMTKYFPFFFDKEGFMVNQKCFIMTGENLNYLASFLNSDIFKICFKDYFPELQGGTKELSKVFFEMIPIPKPVEDKVLLEDDIYKLYDFNDSEINWLSASVSSKD